MLPWVHLGTAIVPGGGGELRLMQRGTEFVIMAGRVPLMNSRMSGSEEALATLGWAPIATRPRPHILIGGLGMGFTLRAALAALPDSASVVVAELVPSVIAWARGPMAEIFGDSLADARVTIEEADVANIIAMSRAAYDAILLDVDNGPDGLTRSHNDRLYSVEGLRASAAALRPGGSLAVWSAHDDPKFVTRLERSGFAVEQQRVRSHGNRGSRHTIWLATRR
jgi:spermidine synthase